MDGKMPVWEKREEGVNVLKLYGTVLNPDWPYVVVLKLSAKKFQEFESDPIAFDKHYEIFHPQYPIKAISGCKPPQVSGIESQIKDSDWTVTIVKSPACRGTYTAATGS